MHCLARRFRKHWGNSWNSLFPKGYETVLSYYFQLPIDQFVLDCANRERAGIKCLKGLPKDKEVQVVLDIRATLIESPEQVAGRVKKVLKVVPRSVCT